MSDSLIPAPGAHETKFYSDGSSATGPGPLPDLSPAQQDAQTAAAPVPVAMSLFTALKSDLSGEAKVLRDAIMDKAGELEALFASVTPGEALSESLTHLQAAVLWITKELHLNA